MAKQQDGLLYYLKGEKYSRENEIRQARKACANCVSGKREAGVRG